MKRKAPTGNITMQELDAILFPSPKVDVNKLTVAEALRVLKELRRVFK